MTTFNLTCDAVEATLPDYIDETLEPWLRESIEQHLDECASCSLLARELRSITREVAALPPLLPDDDVWPRVAKRIGARGVAAPIQQPEPVSAPSEEIPVTPDPSLPNVEPAALPTEREGLSDDGPVPANEPLLLENEPSVVAREPEMLTDEPSLLTSEPSALSNDALLFANEPSWSTKEFVVRPTEPPVLADVASIDADEPSLFADEPSLFADEPSLFADAPSALADETPVLADAPSVVASEPSVFASPPSLQHTVPNTVLFPVRPPRSWAPVWMGLAAAALVLATAGTTFLFTVRWVRPAATASVASAEGTPTAPSRERGSAEPRTRGRVGGRERVPADSTTLTPGAGEPPSALAVTSSSGSPAIPSAEDAVYDSEIDVLQRIVQRQKAHLDASTTSVIEKNLGALDSAIAQIRSALKKDPQSAILDDQASRALQMKVELLRRTAMLRSSTI
jgi:putative zinc finger protein